MARVYTVSSRIQCYKSHLNPENITVIIHRIESEVVSFDWSYHWSNGRSTYYSDQTATFREYIILAIWLQQDIAEFPWWDELKKLCESITGHSLLENKSALEKLFNENELKTSKSHTSVKEFEMAKDNARVNVTIMSDNVSHYQRSVRTPSRLTIDVYRLNIPYEGLSVIEWVYTNTDQKISHSSTTASADEFMKLGLSLNNDKRFPWWVEFNAIYRYRFDTENKLKDSLHSVKVTPELVAERIDEIIKNPSERLLKAGFDPTRVIDGKSSPFPPEKCVSGGPKTQPPENGAEAMEKVRDMLNLRGKPVDAGLKESGEFDDKLRTILQGMELLSEAMAVIINSRETSPQFTDDETATAAYQEKLITRKNVTDLLNPKPSTPTGVQKAIREFLEAAALSGSNNFMISPYLSASAEHPVDLIVTTKSLKKNARDIVVDIPSTPFRVVVKRYQCM